MGIGIENYRDGNLRFPNTADLGAQRVLGMGGSLTGYINTGDAYHKDYYIGGSSNSRYKNKNKIKIPDTIKAIALTGAMIASLGLLKSGKVNWKNIINKNSFNTFKNNVVSKVKNFNLKNFSLKNIKIKNIFNNFKTSVKNFNFKDKLNNLVSKFKTLNKKP